MLKKFDIPIFNNNGGTQRDLVEFGVYSITGSGTGPTLTIPAATSALNASSSPPIFFIKNKAAFTITVNTSGPSFSINNILVATYPIPAGRSAMILFDGAHYVDLLYSIGSLTQENTPVTGDTITLVNNLVDEYTLILSPAGTLATLTVNFPTANLRAGQKIRITSTQAVTALTIASGTFNGAVTSLSANTPVMFIYSATNTAWYRG